MMDITVVNYGSTAVKYPSFKPILKPVTIDLETPRQVPPRPGAVDSVDGFGVSFIGSTWNSLGVWDNGGRFDEISVSCF